MIPPDACKYCWEDGFGIIWYWAWEVGTWFCIVDCGTKTDWYEWFGGAVNDCADMKALGSETGIDFSGFPIESSGFDGVEPFTRPAFFASWAANVERTEVIISWEELEAASLSATSAAMAAVDFLGVCPDFAFASIGGVLADGFDT
jgi:hypothetical protein